MPPRLDPDLILGCRQDFLPRPLGLAGSGESSKRTTGQPIRSLVGFPNDLQEVAPWNRRAMNRGDGGDVEPQLLNVVIESPVDGIGSGRGRRIRTSRIVEVCLDDDLLLWEKRHQHA